MRKFNFSLVFLFFFFVMCIGMSSAQSQERCPKRKICGQLIMLSNESEEPDQVDRFLLKFDDGTFKLVNQNKLDLKNAINHRVVIDGKLLSDSVVVNNFSVLDEDQEKPINTITPFNGQKVIDVGNDDVKLTSPGIYNAPGPALGNRVAVVARVIFVNDVMPSEEEIASQGAAMEYAFFSPDGFSTSNFFKISSKYARLNLTGTVLPFIVRIPRTEENCENNMFNTWTNDVNAALANNPQWTSANIKVLMFRDIPSCVQNGLATVGPKGDPG
ncbi:MAG: hypothetical protein WAU07_04075, partial [Microgenomates group bacterium]